MAKKWEVLTIISILPYTDGFFGSIFYILGRFGNPQSCQKVAKKWILSDESGQTNLKKVPKWLDLVEPSVEGKIEKMAKFRSFFWEKRPVYYCKFQICQDFR